MVERMPLIIEPNPDVWLIVPDPVRRLAPVARPMIRIGQLRAVQRAAYFKPQGRRRIFILDGADTMRWTDADVFLKILEEPPESATLILLAPTPDSLLQTIRSRCLQFHFAPVPAERSNRSSPSAPKPKHPNASWPPNFPAAARAMALALNLEESARLRRSVLSLLEEVITAERPAKFSPPPRSSPSRRRNRLKIF